MKNSTLMALRRLSLNHLVVSGIILGASTTALAGNIKTAIDGDITLSGGASAGYFYGTNTGSTDNDNFVVSDFLLNFASEDAKTGGVSFVAGFGNLAQVTVLAPSGSGADADSSLRYASLTYVPVSNLSIEAGVLATNVGAELATSYDNGNITLGALWNAQPLYYPGARVSYAVGDMTIYGEASSPNAFGAGVLGSAGAFSYAINYFDYDEGANVFDIVVNGDLGMLDVGLNLDFQTLDEKPAGSKDDSAVGVGVYVTPKFGNIKVPVRAEYISDGDSGIYGFDSGYTFTITPTMSVSKNAFVRLELSFVAADNEIFVDEDGDATDSNTGAAFQMGYTF